MDKMQCGLRLEEQGVGFIFVHELYDLRIKKYLTLDNKTFGQHSSLHYFSTA